ncbi:MAG: hypothetical protein ACRYG2_23855, partial [Janthinobacterium lividum]
GRVALLGDAAEGNTLGGFGTGLAIVGAYVLAGELFSGGRRPHGRVRALRGVVPRLREGLAEGQPPARSWPPKTRLGMRLRTCCSRPRTSSRR